MGTPGQLSMNFAVTNLLSSQFQATVNWLSTTGDASLKATPSIVTLDGHPALFSSTQRTWLELDNAETSRPREEVRYGVELKLLPRIASNSEVVLEIISAQVSDLTTSNEGRPTVVAHQVSNTVRMKEGETLVLGGLLQKKKRYRITKVPYLGDIPILGAFFRREESAEEEKEVLIVIRPKILSENLITAR